MKKSKSKLITAIKESLKDALAESFQELLNETGPPHIMFSMMDDDGNYTGRPDVILFYDDDRVVMSWDQLEDDLISGCDDIDFLVQLLKGTIKRAEKYQRTLKRTGCHGHGAIEVEPIKDRIKRIEDGLGMNDPVK